MIYDPSAYFQQLLKRVRSASNVQFRKLETREGEMKLNDCHRNVDRWVESHIETKAVRGWIFWPADQTGRYIFMAHSVIEENGQLFDITPIDGNTPRDGLVFLKHLGTEEEFLRLKTSCSHVVFPPFAYQHLSEAPPVVSDDADS